MRVTMLLLRLPIRALSLGLALVACGGSSDSKDTQNDATGDTRYRPATNGVAAPRAASCSSLSTAVANAHKKLCASGVYTAPTCPGDPGNACMSFDQGTVNGCVDYYSGASSCDDVGKRQSNCVVVCK